MFFYTRTRRAEWKTLFRRAGSPHRSIHVGQFDLFDVLHAGYSALFAQPQAHFLNYLTSL